jgi:hypothetical protein
VTIVRVAVCLLLSSAASVPLAGAQGVENFRTVYVSFGTGIGLSGTVIQEAAGTVDGLPAVFVEQAFSTHYSDGFKFKVGGSYGLGYDAEVFATLAYGRLNATERIVGTVAGYPLYTRFSTARTFDLEGGYRYYFLPEGPLRTYVAGVAGLRFMEDVNATFRVVEVGLTVSGREYFDNSTLFVFGGDAGITRDVTENVAIGGELGLRFQPKPNQVALDLGPGLDEVNDTGSRWSIPLNVFVIYRF